MCGKVKKDYSASGWARIKFSAELDPVLLEFSLDSDGGEWYEAVADALEALNYVDDSDDIVITDQIVIQGKEFGDEKIIVKGTAQIYVETTVEAYDTEDAHWEADGVVSDLDIIDEVLDSEWEVEELEEDWEEDC